MSALAQIVDAIEAFNRSVEAQVRRARTDPKAGAELRRRWRKIRSRVPTVETPTGLKLPRLALPETDEPGELARILLGED